MEFSNNTFWYFVVAACALLFVLSVGSYFRSSLAISPGKKWTLIGLRGSSIVVTLFLLLDPHLMQKEQRKEPVEVAILVDASRSMSLSDSPSAKSRWEGAMDYLRQQTSLMSQEIRVSRYTFGDSLEKTSDFDSKTPDQKTSDLGQALEEILAEGRELKLSSVLLVSDGQCSDGHLDGSDATLEVVRKYRQAGIPIYSYRCGTTTELPDLSITNVTGRQIVPFEPRVQVKLFVGSAGYQDQSTILSVRCNEQLLHESVVDLNGESQEFTVEFESPFEGFYTYDVNLSSLDGERLAHNNSARVGIEIVDEKIRVLYMEGSPGLTEHLQNELEADPQMEVQSFYAPYHVKDIEKARGYPSKLDRKGRRVHNVVDPENGYPRDLKSLCYYDVVINSDIYRQMFTQEQLENTVAFVEKFGGGFVMVGGTESFGAGYYDETVIDKLIPVDCAGARDAKWTTFGLDISKRAIEHPIMQVGKTKEESIEAWGKQFPGFKGLNIANRTKPGAITLARHETMENQYGKLVVFAVQQIGRGRTMAFTSDTTPAWGTKFERWGKGDDESFYYRQFWNNAIRWLAADRIARKQGEFCLTCSQPQAVQNERVQLAISTTNLVASNIEPEKVSVRSIAPDDSESDLTLARDITTNALVANFAPTQTGTYRFTARRQLGEDDDEVQFSKASLEVRPDLREIESTQSNPELLEKISSTTNATSLNDLDTQSVRSLMQGSQTNITEFRQKSIWDNLPVMFTLVGLLAGEWFLRRTIGLV